MSIRLNKVIKEFNVGLQTVVDFLAKKGHKVNASPSEKIDDAQYELLRKEFGSDKDLKNEAEKLFQDRQKEKEKEKAQKKAAAAAEMIETTVPEELRPKVVVKGTVDLNPKPAPAPTPAPAPAEQEEPVSAPATPEPTPAPEPEPAPEPTPAPAPEAETVATGESKAESDAAPAPAKPAEGKKHKEKPSVEERAKAIGEEQDGVFKLHTKVEVTGPKVLGTIDLSSLNQNTRPKKKTKEERRKEREEKNRQAAGTNGQNGEKRKRNRIGKEKVDVNAAANQPQGGNGRRGNNQGGNAQGGNAQGGSKRQKERNRKAQAAIKPEVSDEDVAKQVKETLARLTSKTKASKGAKYRKEKREQARAQQEEQMLEAKAESKVLKLTEFVTANELATMMDVPVTKVIGTCMSIGIMVSINQRMDAETIDLVAEEFGFKTEFVSADVQDAIAEEEDNEEDLEPRAPIVTVMGHVDHGKTSLLDYIRKANVIAGEAGGITQHIGAYNVTLENGRHITFLDTPGHEAFTAMRARGAQVTDIAIIIIAADDDIMPQTKEAINHAVAANVPIVFAINKIDKPHANPDKIKESLAAMNFLVEEWGGKYQSHDISAKKGIGVNDLLDKVLLEADMLELKANPNRRAVGTVIESSLDKGRGYVATVLVSNGTLRQGDVVLAGTNFGKVKALFNERNQRVQEVGPSQAATLLGFNGAPQAGDQFHVMETEQEAREIANKREQLQREQDLRTHKMLTLDEVGRRIKLGSFKELNIIVKGDVDGSVEALSDSFIKLSTETIAVNVIHKGVGQISENDVTLAAASQAVIVGFQVRPSQMARKLAEKEGVEIRQYSVIYDAIEEVKEAMEGMLEPVLKEELTATIEVRQVYHISKVGFVAGAYVMDGKVKRSDKARLIRDGIVIFTGEINALKRFKDDVKEVTTNFECGISLTNCNDIKEGDIIETFQEIEVKQKL
ncbi:MAG: translation initiation factor IF-2 [Bacteroidales bacterium]|nr:translation initiation factor IF-2 [Bacteroidales bacterium]MCI6728419.1 translation initiation factor IF-2 [Bacteroidales bacterium]